MTIPQGSWHASTETRPTTRNRKGSLYLKQVIAVLEELRTDILTLLDVQKQRQDVAYQLETEEEFQAETKRIFDTTRNLKLWEKKLQTMAEEIAESHLFSTQAEPPGTHPANAEETPPEINLAPAKAEESLPKVDLVPTKAEESLPEIDLVPAKAESLPEVDLAPANAEETPPEIDLAPAKTETPPEIDLLPTKAEESLPEIDLVPAKAETLPEIDLVPANAESLPEIDLVPAKAEETLPKVDLAPAEVVLHRLRFAGQEYSFTSLDALCDKLCTLSIDRKPYVVATFPELASLNPQEQENFSYMPYEWTGTRYSNGLWRRKNTENLEEICKEIMSLCGELGDSIVSS